MPIFLKSICAPLLVLTNYCHPIDKFFIKFRNHHKENIPITPTCSISPSFPSSLLLQYRKNISPDISMCDGAEASLPCRVLRPMLSCSVLCTLPSRHLHLFSTFSLLTSSIIHVSPFPYFTLF